MWIFKTGCRLCIIPMAERFPGDEATANGFGRRSLREQES